MNRTSTTTIAIERTIGSDRFLLVLVSALFIGYALWRLHIVGVNFTDSEPVGLYLVGRSTPIVGRMVILRPLFKHVRGKPGDVVAWTPHGVLINNQPVLNSAPPKDTHGYRLQPFGTYRLAPGQYWLMGTGSDSWDSRFAGPFPWDSIATQVYPLWTWRNR
jgi:type IV secretory pathway protease TraF